MYLNWVPEITTEPLLSHDDYRRLLARVIGMGVVIRHGFDRKGYEQRERLDAIAECPKCGRDVLMWAETEEHVYRGWDGKWIHSEYGPPTGFCCGLLILDNFGRCESYDLRAKRQTLHA